MRKSQRACRRSRRRSEAEEEDGVTEEEGVPEAGTVTQPDNPLCETIAQMAQMHEMVVNFLTAVIP